MMRRRFLAACRRRSRPVWSGILALSLLAGGCGEPVTTYQVPGTCIGTGRRVLVLPFNDTRTFVDNGDPHRGDLSGYARDIFVAAMRENEAGIGSEILTPEAAGGDRSLTNAEAAEIGRAHKADVVIAGQIFSFTGTRAASIPPRAGMFVRVISARDGALLFVGDHYQSAAVPGAGGGRDLQARLVADRLVEGMAAQARNRAVARNRVASGTALASIASGRRVRVGGNKGSIDGLSADGEPLPAPPPWIELSGGTPLEQVNWNDRMIPEAPPIIDYAVDFYTLPARPAEPVVEPVLSKSPDPVGEEAEKGEPSVKAAVGETEAVAEVVAEDAAVESLSEPPVEAAAPLSGDREADAPDGPLDASHAARMTGDELAADLFASEGVLEEILAIKEGREPEAAVAMEAAPAEAPAAVAESEAEIESPPATVADYSVALEALEDAIPPVPDDPETAAAPVADPEPPAAVAPVPDVAEYAGDGGISEAAPPRWEDDGPIFSVPLVIEQPRGYKSVDRVAAPARSDQADSEVAGGVAAGQSGAPAESDGIRVLLLPYHDRANPNNLIERTGGGEVVTTLYGAQLAMDSGLRVMWDGSGQVSHDRLVDREEAVAMGRIAGADYVVRGQVVEFRRAQSVPSFYSAMISTAVLAAQIFFAEMSGVDVATEVYRVSDGACVMSRRDRAQQKYVVQAEKTVRRIAAGMAAGVSGAVRAENPEIMEPLIDTLEPLTVFSNPR